jgi:hypothetical protein
VTEGDSLSLGLVRGLSGKHSRKSHGHKPGKAVAGCLLVKKYPKQVEPAARVCYTVLYFLKESGFARLSFKSKYTFSNQRTGFCMEKGIYFYGQRKEESAAGTV